MISKMIMNYETAVISDEGKLEQTYFNDRRNLALGGWVAQRVELHLIMKMMAVMDFV